MWAFYSSNGIDCTDADAVTGFTMSYSQPAGSYIYIAFCTGGNWFSLNTAGNAVNISSTPPGYALLSEKGNTPAQLQALSTIPAFIHKSVQVVVGLAAESSSAMPKIKMSVKCSANEQKTQKTEYSPIYELGDDAMVTSISYEGTTSAGGALDVKAQTLKPDGTYSGWKAPADLAGTPAQSIQIRAIYSAPDIGSSSASLSSVQTVYFNSQYSAVEGRGEIISQTLDWHLPVKACRVNIRHSPLGDSTMRVFAAFRASPILILGEQLGIGSGTRKTFQMAHKNGIKYDTVKVYYDGVRIFTGWELNCEVGRITCSAQSGVIVSCDYEYGWDTEAWTPLSLYNSYSLEDYDESEYRYEGDANNCSVCAIKISLATKTGNASNESIGTATGSAKTFKLKYKASANPTIYADGTALDRKNYTLLSDPQYVRIAAGNGKKLTASYKWISETPRVYRFTSVFSA